MFQMKMMPWGKRDANDHYNQFTQEHEYSYWYVFAILVFKQKLLSGQFSFNHNIQLTRTITSKIVLFCPKQTEQNCMCVCDWAQVR